MRIKTNPMILPKDLIEQVEKNIGHDNWCNMLKHPHSSRDCNCYMEEILELISLAYRRGAEDMGKAIDEVQKRNPALVSQPAPYKGSDANVWREGWNASIRLIQERKDNFLK